MPYSQASKRLVQAVAGLGSAIAPFLVASMFVAAPTIGQDLGAEVAELGWLTAAFFLMAAALLVPFGRLADVKGARKVFTGGIAVYLASSVICALSPDMAILLAGRALTGVGAAMVFGTSIALLGLVFPEEERGKAIGLNIMAMFAGFGGGLLLGGLLTYYLSWRIVFLVSFALAIADLLLILSRVKGECELSREKVLDVKGMATYAVGVVLSIYGISELGSAWGPVFLIIGGAVMGLFIITERRRPHPLVNRRITGEREFVWAAITNIVFQSGAFAIPFLLSLHFQIVEGLDAREAGLFLLLPQLLMVALGPVGGRFADRRGGTLVAGTGCVINTMGVALFILAGEEPSVMVLAAALALVGAGTGLFMPAVVSWALGNISRADYGVASSLTETTRLVGMTLSNVVMILVFGAVLGTSSINQASHTEFITAATSSAVAYLLLSMLSVLLAYYRLSARGRLAPRSTTADAGRDK